MTGAGKGNGTIANRRGIVDRRLTVPERAYNPTMRPERKAERATERIEIRWKESEKQAVVDAAEASGLTLSTIIINGALREAARVLKRAADGDFEVGA